MLEKAEAAAAKLLAAVHAVRGHLIRRQAALAASGNEPLDSPIEPIIGDIDEGYGLTRDYAAQARVTIGRLQDLSVERHGWPGHVVCPGGVARGVAETCAAARRGVFALLFTPGPLPPQHLLPKSTNPLNGAGLGNAPGGNRTLDLRLESLLGRFRLVAGPPVSGLFMRFWCCVVGQGLRLLADVVLPQCCPSRGGWSPTFRRLRDCPRPDGCRRPSWSRVGSGVASPGLA
jgi:hypothetical protein